MLSKSAAPLSGVPGPDPTDVVEHVPVDAEQRRRNQQLEEQKQQHPYAAGSSPRKQRLCSWTLITPEDVHDKHVEAEHVSQHGEDDQER